MGEDTNIEVEGVVADMAAGAVAALAEGDVKPMLMLLGREAILNADDLKTADVEVPEWNGVVRVRALRGVDRDLFEQSLINTDDEDEEGKVKTKVNMLGMRARLVALGAVDGEGVLLFSEADAEKLGYKSAAALERVCDEVMRLSGMNKSEVEKLGKGSSEALSEGSDTD